jgi:hypothetical protein
MNDKTDDMLSIAKRCDATVYTNRHLPAQPAVAFGNEAWAKFCQIIGATGYDEEMGFLIDAANKGELAAYEFGCQGMMAALERILTGKDTGAGVSNPPWEALRRQVIALVARANQKPIDMVLHCPKCGLQHVDAAEVCSCGVDEDGYCNCSVHKLWRNPPHRSHLCHGCKTIWRPADVPTNGVAAISTRGKADTWPPLLDRKEGQ